MKSKQAAPQSHSRVPLSKQVIPILNYSELMKIYFSGLSLKVEIHPKTIILWHLCLEQFRWHSVPIITVLWKLVESQNYPNNLKRSRKRDRYFLSSFIFSLKVKCICVTATVSWHINTSYLGLVSFYMIPADDQKSVEWMNDVRKARRDEIGGKETISGLHLF